MSYVGTSRIRVQVAGGRWGNGGTALNASGIMPVVHTLNSGPRTLGAILASSSPAGTANNTRWVNIRLSGTVMNVCVLSAGARTASITNQGWWFAVG